MIWHSHCAEDVLRELNTDRHVGLADESVHQRLKEYGENQLAASASEKPRYFSINEPKGALCVALVVAAVASAALSLYDHFVNSAVFQWQPFAAILAVLLLIVLPETLQQRRRRAILSRHKKETAPSQVVRRNGQTTSIPVYALVPGDIIELQAGDVVPADCRLLEATGLKCDESILTNAAAPADKVADSVFADITPLTQRANMLYAGCSITSGQAVAVVVATGKQSEMGYLAVLSSKDGSKATLHRSATTLLRQLSLPLLIICLVVGIVHLCLHGELMGALTATLSLAIAAVPTGLSVIVPAAWTDFVKSKTANIAVVKRPDAMETLGNVSVLCLNTDHIATGGHSELCRAFVSHQIVELNGEPPTKGLQQLLRLAALSAHMGDPDEAAILSYIRRVDTNRDLLLMDMPRVGEVPTDHLRKRTTVVHQADDRAVVIVKGAPESVFPCCSRGHTDEAIAAATALEKATGRVTAVAYKILDTIPTAFEAELLECNLTLAGLLCTTDAPDQQTEAAMRVSATGDIHTVLFTPDRAASRLGILPEGALSISGPELEAMSDDELKSNVRRYRAFFRVTTQDKCRIVKAFREQGEVVAVTAIDTQDIPVVQAADIGCAMGQDSSATAKEAADAIIVNNAVAPLVAAILDSRRVTDSIRRTARYLLSTCLATLITFGALIAADTAPSPLLPLWITLVVSSVLLPALTKERPSKSRVTPHHRAGVLFPRKGVCVFLQGATPALSALLAFILGRDVWYNEEMALSMAFVALGLGLIAHAVSAHTSRFLFNARFRDNRHILPACAAAVALILLVALTPGLRSLFSLAAIEPGAFAAVIGLALLPLPMAEFCKYLTKN